MAVGTATIDFGSTPSDTATILVSGLSGLSGASHLEAFILGSDSVGENDATAHAFLSFSGRPRCEYVSATSMNIVIDLLLGLATGQFTVHYETA